MRVAIVGGGASGLVQLKCLKEAHLRFAVPPLEIRLFEAHEKLGGVFHTHSYEEAELVSSKFLTAFSDFPAHVDQPDFFSAERYVDYLNKYATQFNLWAHIKLRTKVASVKRGDRSEHVISYNTPAGDAEEWECDAISVCSGVHSVPNIPELPGINYVPTVMHAQDFKSREQFGKDKTVMILGSGETAMDIAYLAITSDAKRVLLCHRSGWLAAPKTFPNVRFLPQIFGLGSGKAQLPVDVGQITLFDSMYVHPLVRDGMLIWNYYHYMALYGGAWTGSGSLRGWDQWVGQIYGERFHASRTLFNKAWLRVSNYISTPWRPTNWSLVHQIRRFFFYNPSAATTSRSIDVAPFPSRISADGIVHFQRTTRPEYERIASSNIKPDLVIFATGYLPAFPFLNAAANKGRKPYPTAADANVRQIWDTNDPTVGFIGFVRPGFGAIPPLAELQAMLFTMNLIGHLPHSLDPDDEWHYRILHPPDVRITYGVEHDSYAYQLAKDIDGAPSFSEVLRLALHTNRGWRLPYIWALGGPLNAKFRMRGPWRWSGAAGLLTGPMWETIERREGVDALASGSVLPMLYLGCINLFFYLYGLGRASCAKLGLARSLQVRNEPKRVMEELRLRSRMK